MILFFFYLIIWWGIGIASESKLEVLKKGCFGDHNCFYYFLLFYLIILFIIIATSNIWGDKYNSYIWVGKHFKRSTGIKIPTNTHVCLEVNTHTEILDYFINNRHVKDRVENVPKDVYFGVWYFFCYTFFFLVWVTFNFS
jgi:hypothetical protein